MKKKDIILSREIYVTSPKNWNTEKQYTAIFMNDGDMLEKMQLPEMDCFVFGIVPRNRMAEYTPWKEKAFPENTEDFGGRCKEYTEELVEMILPTMKEKYPILDDGIAYGGYSLGGLAAVYSLFLTDVFPFLFSVCGSFWYPGFAEYVEKEKVVNRSANLFLLNGEREASRRNVLLRNAFQDAKRVHQLLGEKEMTCVSMFDKYGHHEKLQQRMFRVCEWLKL